MTEISNTDNCGLQDIRKNAPDTEPEPLVSTQEQVNEQIKTYIALISKQLELIQWIKKAHPSNLPLTASTSARLTIAGTSSDNKYWCFDLEKHLFVSFPLNYAKFKDENLTICAAVSLYIWFRF